MHHRPALPIGPQPQIDAVGHAQLGRSRSAAGPPRGPGCSKNSTVADRPRAVGLAVAVVEEDQVDVAGVVQLAAAQLAHAQDDEPGRLAVGAAGVAPLRARASARRPAGPLPGSRRPGRKSARVTVLQALLADDVAVGDPQRLAALEAPQRASAPPARGPGPRPPPPGPRRASAAATGAPSVSRSRSKPSGSRDQQVAEVLAGGEDLHQRRAAPSGSRSNSVPIASGLRAAATKRSRLFSAMSGSARAGQMLGQLIADHRQQIERQAGRGHADQVGVGLLRVRHAPGPQPAAARRRDRRGSGAGWRCPWMGRGSEAGLGIVASGLTGARRTSCTLRRAGMLGPVTHDCPNSVNASASSITTGRIWPIQRSADRRTPRSGRRCVRPTNCTSVAAGRRASGRSCSGLRPAPRPARPSNGWLSSRLMAFCTASSSLFRRRLTSSGTSSAYSSAALVPGRGLYLKMKLFLNRAPADQLHRLLENPPPSRRRSRR